MKPTSTSTPRPLKKTLFLCLLAGVLLALSGCAALSGNPSSAKTIQAQQPQAVQNAGEARIRYIIADIQLGNVADYYRKFSEPEVVESLRRWDRGVRVTNLPQFERKNIDKQGWTVVYKGTQRTVLGMDILLSSDTPVVTRFALTPTPARTAPPPPTNTIVPAVAQSGSATITGNIFYCDECYYVLPQTVIAKNLQTGKLFTTIIPMYGKDKFTIPVDAPGEYHVFGQVVSASGTISNYGSTDCNSYFKPCNSSAPTTFRVTPGQNLNVMVADKSIPASTFPASLQNPLKLWFVLANPTQPGIDRCNVTVNGVLLNIQGPWNWSWGDGSTQTGYFPQKHTYAKGGIYWIKVSANSGQSNSIGIDLTQYCR